MSDFPEGSDWWKATDGRWYAPPSSPDNAPPADAPAPAAEVRAEERAKAEAKTGRGCLIAVVVIVGLVIIGSVMGSDDDEGGSSSGPDKYGAFDVCTKFVEDRLRAPGTASFPDVFEDDGEVVATGSGANWTIRSHVDAENAFGGEVRTDFVCQVRHVSGTQWVLINLTL